MKKTILVVDDDHFFRTDLCEKLHDRGFNTLEAGSVSEALKVLRSRDETIHVAVLDARVPASPGKAHSADTALGKFSGLKIARAFKQEQPQVKLVGMSTFADEEVSAWFAEYGYTFLPKSWYRKGAAHHFIDAIQNAASRAGRRRKPHCFIVHGHDNGLLLELSHFVRDALRWPRPRILRELPSCGRTIIEKFEDAAETIDVVFVLFTPDDVVVSASGNDALRRARQNVVFELGYFYAKLQRLGGRVLVLHRGQVELPSDISGIVYIDVSHGIESAGETIRRELSQWLR